MVYFHLPSHLTQEKSLTCWGHKYEWDLSSPPQRAIKFIAKVSTHFFGKFRLSWQIFTWRMENISCFIQHAQFKINLYFDRAFYQGIYDTLFVVYYLLNSRDDYKKVQKAAPIWSFYCQKIDMSVTRIK